MQKRVLNLIIFLVSTFVFAISFCGFKSVPTSFAADDIGAESVYDVIFPDANKYLFLSNPSVVATCDGVIAVYDESENKIFTAGDEHFEYSPVLDDEKIVDLAFANDTLYYLTNRSRLYDVKAGKNVALDDKIVTDISAYGGALYLYNSLVNVWRFDGATFSSYKDGGFKIIKSDAFAATDSNAYFVNDGKLFVLDYSTNLANGFEVENEISSLSVSGDDLYAVSDGKVYKVDFENKSLVNVALPSVRSLSSDGDTLVLLPADDNAVYTFDSSLREKGMYGSKSTKDYWFDAPERVFSENGNIAVWDKSNARIQFFFSDGTHKNLFVSKSTSSVAVSKTHTAYSDGNTVTVVKNDDFSARTFDTNKNVGAISLTDDAVVIYDKNTNAIYTAGLNGSEFSLFAYSRANVSKIKAISGDNPTVYTMAGDIVSALTKTTDFSVTLKNAVSFDVDNTGNVVVLLKSDSGFDVGTLKRTASSLEFSHKTTLHGDFETLNLSDVGLDLSSDGDVYLVDSVKNVLIKTSYSFDNDKTAYENPFYTSDVVPENVAFARSQGTVVYSFVNNFLKISDVVPSGDVVCILGKSGDMLFVMTKNKKVGYTLDSDLFLVRREPSPVGGQVTAVFDSVSVFDYPGADGVVFDKTQIFTLVDDCAGFGINGNFLKVSYSAGGTTRYGYVYKTSVMSYVPENQSTAKAVYAKAKSQRVGTTVNAYALPDDTSLVVFDVADGTKLKLLQEYDENSKFTLVEYNGKQGYVLTSSLKIDKGLTGGQIAAIVLASATVLITATYFVISRRNKKISNKN